MDIQKQNEEKLREACCYGDNEAVLALLSRGIDVNSQHEINGWTGLHWACKRGKVDTVRLLLGHNADSEVENNLGQQPYQLTNDTNILSLLGLDEPSEGEDRADSSDTLPITPNYIVNPPMEYKVSTPSTSSGKPVPNGVPESNGHTKMLSLVNQSAHNSHSTPCSQSSLPANVIHQSSHPLPHPVSTHDNVARHSKEIVVKVRMADSEDPDFIEVDIQRSHLNYSHLLTTCCRELALNPQMVERIRKLPNTRLRNDRDTQRLSEYTELEFVMKGHSRPAAKAMELPF
ncbi:hypothetical protein Pmani_038691 [Petrolisthes manimaculis]|uniref:Ankyrin repeat domain-containing protein 40 n=1 Tax=Petrolisthes manimaculis TaxID=1843537 RepID=A0AAE1TK61_9EUCA|nr:hypothetical protein Pmani_038691 [Petrolisthes manimaculis]